MGTVFLSILNQMDFHLVQNREENCHYDHIPLNVKENANIVFFSVQVDSHLLYVCLGFVGGILSPMTTTREREKRHELAK